MTVVLLWSCSATSAICRVVESSCDQDILPLHDRLLLILCSTNVFSVRAAQSVQPRRAACCACVPPAMRSWNCRSQCVMSSSALQQCTCIVDDMHEESHYDARCHWRLLPRFTPPILLTSSRTHHIEHAQEVLHSCLKSELWVMEIAHPRVLVGWMGGSRKGGKRSFPRERMQPPMHVTRQRLASFATTPVNNAPSCKHSPTQRGGVRIPLEAPKPNEWNQI